jgi:MbtH protein
MAFEDGSDPTYLVLVNHEDQYSLWPKSKSVPLGWRETGFAGDKATCASYVDAVWTDMRPASLRAAAEEAS